MDDWEVHQEHHPWNHGDVPRDMNGLAMGAGDVYRQMKHKLDEANSLVTSEHTRLWAEINVLRMALKALADKHGEDADKFLEEIRLQLKVAEKLMEE